MYLPAPMLRIGQYTSVPSRVITFKQIDINAPFDVVTDKIRSLPSGAGKKQCQASVLSFWICLTRNTDKHFFATLSLLSFPDIYSEVKKSEPSIILGQEIIDTLELRCRWRGQKPAQF